MDKLGMEKNMDLESLFIKMVEFTKGNGSMMLKEDLELKNSLMEIYLKENIFMENLMELVLISGVTDKDMMGSGSMDSSKVQECGEGKKETRTKDNGSMENLMDMEFIHGRMEIHMKDNLKIVLNMDKVLKDLQMEISTKEVI